MQIPERFQYDRQLIDRFERLSAKHRRELAALVGNPPDLSQVPESFWDRVEKESREQLAAMALMIFLLSADHHGARHVDGGQSLAASEGMRWSNERAQALASLYVEASRDMLLRQQARRETQSRTTDQPVEVDPLELEEDLFQIFGRGRAERVVHTTVTNAQTYGGEFILGAAGMLSDDDLWINRPLLSRSGPCRICKPLHLQPRTVWEAIFPEGPAAHPHCVCEIRYQNVGRG